MCKSLKVLCVATICFASYCFGEGLDPFSTQEVQENVQERQSAESNKSDYHISSFSESTSVDKDGKVVYDSMQRTSDNGKEAEPRKQHFEGTREEFNKFMHDSGRHCWPPKPQQIAHHRRNLSAPVYYKAQQQRLEECKTRKDERPNNAVPSRIARKAFKKFIGRVAILLKRTFDELQQEKAMEFAAADEVRVRRDSTPDGDRITISDDNNWEKFDDTDDFIRRALAGFFGRGAQPESRNQKAKYENAALRFEKFFRQVQEIAYQTMKEFGIRPNNIERR